MGIGDPGRQLSGNQGCGEQEDDDAACEPVVIIVATQGHAYRADCQYFETDDPGEVTVQRGPPIFIMMVPEDRQIESPQTPN